MTTAICGLGCLALLAIGPLRADNDRFAEPTDLTSLTLPYNGFVGGAGTAEAGEPAHAGSPAAHSYWFQWKAPTSGPCGFREYLNGTASRIAIYTGNTLATLIPVAQGKEMVFFPATAGVVYRIAIDSPGADVVYFKTYPLGGSDDLAAATPITGGFPRRVKGNNVFATAAPTDEDWHPEYHPTATVWWVWTAPSSGAVRMDCRYCDIGTRLTTYERAPGGSPVRVAAGYETTGITVTAGNDYLFCVDAIGDPGEIGFWMEWFPTTAPPNDDVANATDLGSSLIACGGGWIQYATAQAGVPNESIGYPQWGISGDHTLWWKWTCPQSGTYRFSQHGSDGYASVNVFTGSAALLGYVAGMEDRNGVRIAVTAGTTYWIQINDWKKYAVRAELNIHPAASEPAYFTYLANRGIFRLYGAQRHPDADPDGDGFSNELECACYANPEVNAPADPNLPHLLSNGSGWKFLWAQDTSYTGNSIGQPISLTGKVALSPAGPWVTTATFTESGTGRKLINLPVTPRAFARLELNNPNWNPAP